MCRFFFSPIPGIAHRKLVDGPRAPLGWGHCREACTCLLESAPYSTNWNIMELPLQVTEQVGVERQLCLSRDWLVRKCHGLSHCWNSQREE